MINVKFYNPGEIADEKIGIVVIDARYKGKSIFVRQKERLTWEIPGGHRDEGETVEDAVRWELYEETGSAEFRLSFVSVYGVSRDGDETYGALYFADVTTLGELPDFEIAEIRLFTYLPHELTYPEIQAPLYERIQGWLNTMSGAGELWDVYDKDRNLTGKLHRRGDPFEKGEYHLVVHGWILTPDGKVFSTQRDYNKGFGGMWECTGGSALAGEDSLTAILREVYEETGLKLDKSKGEIVIRESCGEDYFFGDVWLFRQDVDLGDVVLLEGETRDKALFTPEEILDMRERDEFCPYDYIDRIIHILKQN